MEPAKIEEKKHLSEILDLLHNACKGIDFRLEDIKQEIKQETESYGENRYNMDHMEKMSIRQMIEQKLISSDHLKNRRKKLNRLIDSPYFGRFDFKDKEKKTVKQVYIGIHNFSDDKKNVPYIYDWRAPISSIFYEHESGLAQYQSPNGIIKGDVLLKRQFKIKDGEIQYLFDSNVHITDDVLQKELSNSSDDGMKNIVATIQHNQNNIIRNEESKVLIIQGVAGSGKTSIALHRIAFLLYRHKETLKSENVLIISPNNVFADYISNVLPELGEEKVGEMQMEKLADQLLSQEYKFQTSFEQTESLLDKIDESFRKRIQFKSSPEFIKQIEDYATIVKKDLFKGKNARVARCLIPNWLFDEVFERYRDYSKKKCVKEMTDLIAEKVEDEYRIKLKATDKTTLKKYITQMHKGVSLLETYKNMFEWLGKPELFKKQKEGKLEYCDVFPMVYLRMQLESKNIAPQETKHLIIDEMQDYSPVQYAVIFKLFSCNKTILGDSNQSVNPYTATTGQAINNLFTEASYVELNKSYRSSYEIMQFVQKISTNQNLELFERHGDKPQVLMCNNSDEENQLILELTDSFLNSNYNTLGIICKTKSQAKTIFDFLEKAGKPAQLLTAQSTAFNQGIIVCTPYIAKGLEFDEVIIPQTTANNYNTAMDKNLLYVACTRAMHRLTLTHTEKKSSFLPK